MFLRQILRRSEERQILRRSEGRQILRRSDESLSSEESYLVMKVI